MSISSPYPGKPSHKGSTLHTGGKRPITGFAPTVASLDIVPVDTEELETIAPVEGFLPHDHKEKDDEFNKGKRKKKEVSSLPLSDDVETDNE